MQPNRSKGSRHFEWSAIAVETVVLTALAARLINITGFTIQLVGLAILSFIVAAIGVLGANRILYHPNKTPSLFDILTISAVFIYILLLAASVQHAYISGPKTSLLIVISVSLLSFIYFSFIARAMRHKITITMVKGSDYVSLFFGIASLFAIVDPASMLVQERREAIDRRIDYRMAAAAYDLQSYYRDLQRSQIDGWYAAYCADPQAGRPKPQSIDRIGSAVRPSQADCEEVASIRALVAQGGTVNLMAEVRTRYDKITSLKIDHDIVNGKHTKDFAIQIDMANDVQEMHLAKNKLIEESKFIFPHEYKLLSSFVIGLSIALRMTKTTAEVFKFHIA